VIVEKNRRVVHRGEAEAREANGANEATISSGREDLRIEFNVALLSTRGRKKQEEEGVKTNYGMKEWYKKNIKKTTGNR